MLIERLMENYYVGCAHCHTNEHWQKQNNPMLKGGHI